MFARAVLSLCLLAGIGSVSSAQVLSVGIGNGIGFGPGIGYGPGIGWGAGYHGYGYGGYGPGFYSPGYYAARPYYGVYGSGVSLGVGTVPRYGYSYNYNYNYRPAPVYRSYPTYRAPTVRYRNYGVTRRSYR